MFLHPIHVLANLAFEYTATVNKFVYIRPATQNVLYYPPQPLNRPKSWLYISKPRVRNKMPSLLYA